ncbi:hypothetical protein IU436_29705 [Nocardia farcinica]|uniref:hypothetical protein n=1 Tax=Nocardia farcinica TaxID=37329 RepID=UPI00189509BF|nr:hypothetical protein [Nocardia farcinica]MBF6422776.1 hypothetical protein [Nocardia farcinica]MBF6434496.1 hypothetical protein [Nocardia farcinica]MBF6505581.1 hypothetical protein [Nocardia farcinica]
MTSTRNWLGIVVVLGLVPVVVLCLINGFFPQWRDLSDPLGRPSTLSNELIVSADQLDQLTAEMAPKHSTLSITIQDMRPLAASLTELTDLAAKLPDSARTVNTATADVAGTARPLPDLITSVVTNSGQASTTVSNMTSAVGGVTTQLNNVDSEMRTVQTTLNTLGPRASTISATLKTIEEEAARVAAFGPLLAILGPAVNGPKQPAPQPAGSR